MDTHFFGTLAVTRAFAPAIAANGGGAILNVLSALSWISFPGIGGYCAAKSAEWSLTNALRQELAPQGIRVSGLHVGYMDTDLTTRVTAPKLDVRDVAVTAVDGIAAGSYEILADETSQKIQAWRVAGSPSCTPLCPDLVRAGSGPPEPGERQQHGLCDCPADRPV